MPEPSARLAHWYGEREFVFGQALWVALLALLVLDRPVCLACPQTVYFMELR